MHSGHSSALSAMRRHQPRMVTVRAPCLLHPSGLLPGYPLPMLAPADSSHGCLAGQQHPAVRRRCGPAGGCPSELCPLARAARSCCATADLQPRPDLGADAVGARRTGRDRGRHHRRQRHVLGSTARRGGRGGAVGWLATWRSCCLPAGRQKWRPTLCPCAPSSGEAPG